MPPFRTAFLLSCLAPLAWAGCGTEGEGDDDTTGAGDDDATPDDDTGADDDTTSGDDDSTPEDYSTSPCWGDPYTTQTFSHQTYDFIDVPGTCRGEGEYALLYVEDEIWENGVDQDAVNTYLNTFEHHTPEGSIDPAQGIWANDTTVFGAPDEDYYPEGKVRIFVLDTDGYGDGYVPSWVEEPVLHIDGVVRPLDDEATLSVTAHEFFHVIHLAFDGNEEVWLDESLAEAAMIVNGYYTDVGWVEDWLNRPDQAWGPADSGHGELHYGAALMWGTWLYEQHGPDFLNALVAERSNGWDAIDAVLAESGSAQIWQDLYRDWMVAQWAEAAGSTDPAFSFAFSQLPDVPTRSGLSDGTTIEAAVEAFGIDYLEVSEGDFEVTLTAEAPEDLLLATAVLDAGAVLVDHPDPSAAFTVGVPPGALGIVALSAVEAADYTVSAVEL